MRLRSPLLTRFEAHAARGAAAIDHGDDDARDLVTYRALLTRAQTVASELLAGHTNRASLDGERIGILVRPGGSFVASLYGVWLAGGCAVVLSPLHPPAESAYLCADARVVTLLVSSELTERLGATLEGRRAIDVDAIVAASPEPEPEDARSRSLPGALAEHDALQLYTSGTTGRPKGAMLTHVNLATQQELLGAAWRFSGSDVLLHALPLHHMHGLAIALLTALGAGARVRMLPSFDAARVWDEMARATVFMGVPTMYTRLCEAWDRADEATRGRWAASARKLRLTTSGSAALPVPLATHWEAIAGVVPVERFGMTEIGVGMTNPVEGPRKKGSVGWPLPTVETRVVDDRGRHATSGELLVRGPSVFRGYYEREDATREAFVPADDGGAAWFKTGDTVARDEDGAFRILGRTSVDILKSGGYKLSALEIESVILTIPAIKEVAVVGVPDERWGERVVACVVAHEGREDECSEERVRAHVREVLAPYKCPKDVLRMKELPRNAMGKVVKPELVRALRASGPGALPSGGPQSP